MNTNFYVLHHSDCDKCVWGKDGFYNPICCHCPWITFGKNDDSSFMSKEMAEVLGLIKNGDKERDGNQ